MNRFSCTVLFKVLLLICGSAVSALQNERELAISPLLENWQKEVGLANLLNDKIESSKTASPTLVPTKDPSKNPTAVPTSKNPTTAPTDHPTATPTLSPSEFPTWNPTTSPSGQPSSSFHPSSQLSSHPSSQPSIAPSTSTMPTAVPSYEPSKMPSSTPSIWPSAIPSHEPSEMPSSTPSILPSAVPSLEPSEMPSNTPSSSPSAGPSHEPSEMPSNAPSSSPSAVPSLEPSIVPSSAPSISGEPTLRTPSSNPSAAPTWKPSSGPSEMRSGAPSLSPSTHATQPPSTSTPPSQSPTEIEVTESIIIKPPNTRNATPLLIVGACCFVVMASTSLYLYSRRPQLRRDKRNRAPSMIEVSAGENFKNGGGMISPYSIEENLGPGHGPFNVNYSESESHASDEDMQDYNHGATNQRRFEDDGDLVDIDLEDGRVGIDEVPNSVSIIKRAQPPNADENNNLPSIIEEPTTPENSRLRMPKSIYVPKMFQRTKELDENSKQVITWNQILEEDRSSASSGYAPASVPSPMLSPFLVKGLSSILSPTSGKGKRGIPMNESGSVEMEDDDAAATQERSTSNQGKRNGVMKSPMAEIVVKRELPRESCNVFANINDLPCNPGGKNSPKEQKSPKTVGSKSSSEGSSIEWGIDILKVPSKASFEANMTELQNLLVSIKSLGSQESDVKMTYTEDTSESNQKPGNNSNYKADQISPKSDASKFLDNVDIAPIESKSAQDNVSTRSESSSVLSYTPTPPCVSPNNQQESEITYERELLNSNRGMSDQGTFNFRNIFNDPKNDLYQSHAPSGPLGIVVDTTPLGPRVRSLNPLSPIFGKISPGDVIVGVDEVDTVGMEAGDFWQVVSRKANQQERILTILRI